MTAPGYCLAKILTRANLGQHFDNRKFALAAVLARTGSAVSLVTMPPLVQLFINTYGWRGTMLLIGSIGAHLVVCGALLIPRSKGSSISNNDYQLVSIVRDPSNNDQRRPSICNTALNKCCLSLGEMLDLSLMKDFNFWIITLIMVVTRITEAAWFIYFVPYTVAKGFTAESAAVMVTAAGCGRLISILLVSVALYKDKVTSTNVIMVSILLMAISFIINPWLNNGWLVASSAVVVAGTSVLNYSLCDVLVKEILGSERIASAFGLIGFISGIVRIFAGFIPGRRRKILK